MVNGLYALINGRLRGVSKVVWKDVSQTALSDDDRTSSLSWTDLALADYTSPTAKFAIVQLKLKADTVGAGGYCYLAIRKNGTTPSHYPQLRVDLAGITADIFHYREVLIGLGSGQVIEYKISVGTNWQIDTGIRVLGYIE